MDAAQEEIIVDPNKEATPKFYEPTENDRELVRFVVEHTDRWREHRDENYLEKWNRYERIFRGVWAEEDKQRQSERSKIISPATQQAVETRHAEVMEAIFGQGEYFDIKDDLNDQNGSVDIEKIKNQLYEDFAQDKIRKSIDQIELLAEIYGTGIGEIIVGQEKQYKPMTVPIDQQQSAYGVGEKDRVTVKLDPINPKNFIFDPNGTTIDDCMGVAVEKYVSLHKIVQGISDGRYLNIDIGMMYDGDKLEPTQEDRQYQDDKITILRYYGLVPKEYLLGADDPLIESEDTEDYQDMVEAIVILANGKLLKAQENPYMMHDRPIICYQDDTVPNRLLGRGTVEKAFNMQVSIDSSIRSHMDSLALTVAPMVGLDATRLPRGAKFEVKPGKAFMTNGVPGEIIYPFNFGTNDGAAMNTSKEFERMLLMATGTIDSNGQVTQMSRDGNMDMATATMIKKYKRTLVNFQEDFLIPFIYKAAWRFMQFDPERYPSVDVKFVPTATLGIIAREYEQKQIAFLIQTLGADSPMAPILMQGIIKNSSLSNREEMLQSIQKLSQPDPNQQAQQEQQAQQQAQLVQAQINETNAKAQDSMASAHKTQQDAILAPTLAKAKLIAALSTNLSNGQEEQDFERRTRIAELMLKEKEVNVKEADSQANKQIVAMQMQDKAAKESKDQAYLDKIGSLVN